MVILDSNHTEEHVLDELNFYSEIVSRKNYLIVQDTGIVHMPEKMNKNRMWSKKKILILQLKNFLKKIKNLKLIMIFLKKFIFLHHQMGFYLKNNLLSFFKSCNYTTYI